MVSKTGKLAIVFLLLLVSVTPNFRSANAQEDSTSTLRGLASLNNIYIGSAAWTSYISLIRPMPN